MTILVVRCASLIVVILCIFVAIIPIECSWWFLSRVETAAMGANAGAVCSLVPGLSRRQRKQCSLHPDAMEAVVRGVSLAIDECQRQFAHDRWNCSAVQNAGFGRILLKLGSREAAFVYAITSAGVTHSLARACAKGSVRDCDCGSRATSNTLSSSPLSRKHHRRYIEPSSSINNNQLESSSVKTFTWGGCDDNVRYASMFARRFVDAKERRQRDSRALMNLHNNRAGRKLLRQHLRIQCKCHGVSGSCTSKTCWRVVPPFDEVGLLLKTKYRNAVQVTVSQHGSQLIAVVEQRRQNPPINITLSRRSTKDLSLTSSSLQRSSLVYFDASPDYCIGDPETGSLGTSGRQCNRTSSSTNSCDVLCCGRGYNTKRVVVSEQCRCKFVWCCQVKCDVCRRVVDIHSCK